ncbi:hypothetical protein [Pantoea dispersa]|uniref:hypothetical protein n=1 Tax=Pantoea dispersa TaxID=59814 RepID=UPI0024AF8650|nr:hypothetical protein [Pantoea dispersa]MDI6636425.1 hypothetical protein [Pantoea dispersa]
MEEKEKIVSIASDLLGRAVLMAAGKGQRITKKAILSELSLINFADEDKVLRDLAIGMLNAAEKLGTSFFADNLSGCVSMDNAKDEMMLLVSGAPLQQSGNDACGAEV